MFLFISFLVSEYFPKENPDLFKSSLSKSFCKTIFLLLFNHKYQNLEKDLFLYFFPQTGSDF